MQQGRNPETGFWPIATKKPQPGGYGFFEIVYRACHQSEAQKQVPLIPVQG